MATNNKNKLEIFDVGENADIEDLIFANNKQKIEYATNQLSPINKVYNNNLCWLNSSTETFVRKFREKTKLTKFNISLNYFLFWHYYEQCCRAFDIIDKSKNTNSTTIKNIIDYGVDDSGNWHDFKKLVLKYGCVPFNSMKETFFFKNTEDINVFLSRHLRSCVIKYLKTNDDSIKTQCLENAYNFLCKTLGAPPKSFKIKIKNNLGHYTTKASTPKELSEQIFKDIEEYVCIIKTNNNHTITNNIDFDYKYFNVDDKVFNESINRTLKEDGVVAIGVDCRYGANHNNNLFDITPEVYRNVLGLDFYPEEDYLYNTKSICTNHNMILVDKLSTGIYVTFNNYFLKGKYSFLSNSWFNKFCLEAVVNKKFIKINNYTQEKKVDMVKNINFI